MAHLISFVLVCLLLISSTRISAFNLRAKHNYRRASFGKRYSVERTNVALHRLQSSLSTENDSVPKREEDDQASNNDQLGAWIPVASKSMISGIGPTRTKIMGMELVVWESSLENDHSESSGNSSNKQTKGESRWSVLNDACPHRLAPLSLGRVDQTTGCIECPYHGWQFNASGTVTYIPQLEGSIPDTLSPSLVKKASATEYPVHITGDLIWAFLPTAVHGESFPKSLLPEDYYYDLKSDMELGAKYYTIEMPASFDFLIENGLDPAHFPFAHHGVVAFREDASPMPMKVESNFTDVSLMTSYQRKGVYRERKFGFQRPLSIYTCQKDLDTAEWTRGVLLFIVPVEEGRCRIMTSLGPSKLSSVPVPDWLMHLKSKALFEGDMQIHEAERFARTEAAKGRLNYVMPTASDKGVNAYRVWYEKHGFSNAPPHTFGPARSENLHPLPRNVQLDNWHTHTKACSICRTALRRFRFAQYWGLVIGLSSSVVAAALRNPLISVSSAGAGFIINAVATKMVKKLEGSSHPSDVSEHNIP